MADPTDPKRFDEVFSTLSNALQTALLLASRLEPDARQTARDAGDLRRAVEAAATAVRELRPGEPGQKGGQ